eukprot:scaffold40647_cov53-Phaeocystis_antarctica.AAC.3
MAAKAPSRVWSDSLALLALARPWMLPLARRLGLPDAAPARLSCANSKPKGAAEPKEPMVLGISVLAIATTGSTPRGPLPAATGSRSPLGYRARSGRLSRGSTRPPGGRFLARLNWDRSRPGRAHRARSAGGAPPCRLRGERARLRVVRQAYLW